MLAPVAPFHRRQLQGRWSLHCAVALACASLWSPAWADAQYDQLIEKARAGMSGPALEYFRREVPAGNAVSPAAADWIEIASWSNLDAEVVQVYQNHAQRVTLSARTLVSVARAYRNLRQWDASIATYEAAINKAPTDIEIQRGYIHVLADARQAEKALEKAQGLVNDAPMDAYRRVTLAYVHTADSRPFAALKELTRARSLAPDAKDILLDYVRALQTAGMPHDAEKIAVQHPALLQTAEFRRLQGDIGAELVRLSFEPASTEAERFTIADRALAHYSKLLLQWAALPTTPDLQKDIERIRIDRLGAYTARVYMQDAVQEYESLQKQNVVMPLYAQRWIAGAYLYLRQPDVAKNIYNNILQETAKEGARRNGDVSGLFYALLETENIVQAVEIAQRKAADNPSPLIYYPGEKQGVPNTEWSDSQQEAAQSYNYADDAPQAQLRLEEMLGRAPGNVGIRVSLAGLYRGRGWPRQAEQSLKLVETMAPNDFSLRVQQGHTALDLQEWRQLEILADDVIAQYPENLQAQRLDRLRHVQRMREIRVSGYRGLSDNATTLNPSTGKGDYGFDAVAYTAPLELNWRGFAGFGWGRGEFTEGRGFHRTLRAGVERRIRDNTIEAEISSHAFGFGRQTGLRLEGSHTINDYWQVGAGIEKLSRSTPLRALTSNITADSANLNVRWSASNRRQWSASLTPIHFSDGNQSLSLSINGKERLYTHPRWYVDGSINIATSRNSQQSGPYFSPEADYTVLPSVDIGHLVYRNYQTEWRQYLQLGLGVYNQKGFGSESIESLAYGQRYRFNDIFDMGWKISWMRRPYDGQREIIWRGTYDMTIKY